MEDTCRLCLSENAKISIFVETKNYAFNMMKRCLPLDIKEMDGLPQFICGMCMNTLGVCDTFLTKCIESDRLLRKQCNEHLIKGVIKIEESVAKYENDDYNYFCDDDNQTEPFNNEILLDDSKIETKNEYIEIEIKTEEYGTVEKAKTLCTSHKVKRSKGNTSVKVPDGKKSSTKAVKKNKKDNSTDCDICNMTFSQRRELLKHISTTHNNNPVTCNICMKTFKNASVAKAHSKRVHKAEPYRCDICGKTFKYKESIQRHKRNHQIDNDMKNIVDPEIKQPYQFPCGICDEILLDKSSLLKHKKRVHLKTIKKVDKMIICDVCGKNVTKSSMRQHLVSHSNQRKFTCNICSKAFKLKGCLVKHVRDVHTDNKCFTCDICKQSYKSKNSLQIHIKMGHFTVKTIDCEFCGMKFKQKHHLKLHQRTHTQERPYQCRFCDSKFAINRSLLEHERLHLGITPYKCPSCPKAFTQLGNMKSHFKHNHKDIVFSQVYKPGRQSKNTSLTANVVSN